MTKFNVRLRPLEGLYKSGHVGLLHPIPTCLSLATGLPGMWNSDKGGHGRSSHMNGPPCNSTVRLFLPGDYGPDRGALSKDNRTETVGEITGFNELEGDKRCVL